MNNNNVLEEFFVWEEKSLIDHNQNLLKNVEQDNSVTTIETKTDSMPKDWRDITDPKLKRKMKKKIYDSVRYNNNKDKIKEQKKAYWEANKDKIKVYREVNKDRIKEQEKIYRKSNKDKINKRDRERKNTNIQFKLSKGLRTRLWSAIKDNQKTGSAVKDLGCSIDELKSYLESKFLPGMNWDNYGLYGWHIDHIKPLASFNLSDRKQLLEACHYTNLQPLWANENLSKGSIVTSA